MGNYFIVITDKTTGRYNVLDRQNTTSEAVNRQATFIWSLLDKTEKKQYRVWTQGSYKSYEPRFDSDKLHARN